MYKIMLSGYFGFNNLGDEAILTSMVDMIKRADQEEEIIILSQNPEMTAKKHKTDSIYRYNLFNILSRMKSSNIFISGGGSLLQDKTSFKTVPYYLGLIFLAQLFKMKTIFFAQGVGPVKNKFYRYLIKKVLKNVDHISVRDENSKKFLISIGINEKNIEVIEDPVYAIKPDIIKKRKNLDTKNIGVSVRDWGSNHYLKILAEFLNSLNKNEDLSVTIIPFHEGKDIKISRKLLGLLETKVKIIEYTDNAKQINDLYSSFDMFIGLRLHSLIFAAVNHIPFIGISYDPKVNSLIKEMGYQKEITTENISLAKLKESYYRIKDDKDEIIQQIKDKVNDKSNGLSDLLRQIIKELKGE
ncbi:MAG: polysaccharide pyruvyl transferase CsaB [Halanaerobiales bacterium]|nr:polysaccharide pyruvyl transferase CsaB [Halanaerobiales bacterium]